MSGNAYLSVSALNSGSGVYPETFQPSPGRLSVQVTKANSETEAAAPASAASATPKRANAYSSPAVQSEPQIIRFCKWR